MAKAEQKGVEIVLPVDHMCSEIFSPTGNVVKITNVDIPADLMGMDIGAKTAKLYAKTLKTAKTIIWNGPMGVFEFENFKKGTKTVAKAVAKNKGKTIVGGGDSLSAIAELKLTEKIYHVSTGGGASMQLIGGEPLPGVDVISEK